ncbi:hypothetical protein EC968_008881 [Mortierella alpina]|nr:hypothetical protein EC968_008881 [Mortierella alpina]
MKKLSIVLIEDLAKDPKQETTYLPGDTIAGHLTFNTSSSIRYTCVKVRFVGLVSTKVAKTAEEVYVLNQQVVLLGNPNNASDNVLPEGKHSWPFEFKVPLHHIPSSGKYRHGSVKYTLTAFITQKTFLGGMQEIKSNLTIQLKDMINCALEPYCSPSSAQGSSNVKPETNKPKNLASANVQLPQSSCVQGQTLQIAIDLSHPKKIQRDPGCWIKLIRKEHYYAGEHTKDYSHVVATTAKALSTDSGSGTGRILAELKIPSYALPTMSTTKIISVQYNLLILFDMRLRVGFLDRGMRRSLSKKQWDKLLAMPGGFEVEVPVVVGTITDKLHRPRPSPFSAAELQIMSGSDANSPISSLVAAASQLSLAAIAQNGSASAPNETLPGSESPSSSSSGTPKFSPRYGNTTVYVPQTQYNGAAPSGSHTLPLARGRQASDPVHRATAPPPTFHSMNPARSPYSFHAPSMQSLPGGQNDGYGKPLPSLPPLSTGPGSASPPSRPLYASPASASPPSRPLYASPVSASPPLRSLHASPMSMSSPHISRHYASNSSTASSSASASASVSLASTSSSSPSSSFTPPGAAHGMAGGSMPIPSTNGHGYPPEKFAMSPPHQHVQIQLPLTVQVQSPTAPRAVDLGMGPASPGLERRHPQRLSIMKTFGDDYFHHGQPQPQSQPQPQPQPQPQQQFHEVPSYHMNGGSHGEGSSSQTFYHPNGGLHGAGSSSQGTEGRPYHERSISQPTTYRAMAHTGQVPGRSLPQPQASWPAPSPSVVPPLPLRHASSVSKNSQPAPPYTPSS